MQFQAGLVGKYEIKLFINLFNSENNITTTGTLEFLSTCFTPIYPPVNNTLVFYVQQYKRTQGQEKVVILADVEEKFNKKKSNNCNMEDWFLSTDASG